jgi:hypothetical protein
MFPDLPGDVWLMLIILGAFLVLALLVIYIGYRLVR